MLRLSLIHIFFPAGAQSVFGERQRVLGAVRRRRQHRAHSRRLHDGRGQGEKAERPHQKDQRRHLRRRQAGDGGKARGGSSARKRQVPVSYTHLFLKIFAIFCFCTM